MREMNCRRIGVLARVAPALAMVAGLASPVLAIDEAHRQRALVMIERAGEYLRSQQHGGGGWAVPEDAAAPVLPAITGLVVNALALEPMADSGSARMTQAGQRENGERTAAMDRGVAFMLSHVQIDGGIYDQQLPSYNTAICVSALCRFREGNAEAEAAVVGGLEFLREVQWSEDAGPVNPDGTPSPAAATVQAVGREHPFYGGIGYGRHGRPDNSNLNLAMQAFHDAGVSRDDPAFQRALVFLRRTQMHEGVNDAEYAKGSRQGGFIYATAETGAEPGVGQSQAGVIEETLDDGTSVSRLRAYGSMTYAAFKTMIYAGLSADDERVRLAMAWINRNYTVTENPGMGTDGMYYYYLMLSRALVAAGVETIDIVLEGGEVSIDEVPGGLSPGAGGRVRSPSGSVRYNQATGVVEFECDWANDLIDQLATLQNEDGSFRSVDDRWMESNPVLISAYAMLALEHAVGLAE